MANTTPTPFAVRLQRLLSKIIPIRDIFLLTISNLAFIGYLAEPDQAVFFIDAYAYSVPFYFGPGAGVNKQRVVAGAKLPTVQSFFGGGAYGAEVSYFKACTFVTGNFFGFIPHALGLLVVAGVAAIRPLAFFRPAMRVAFSLGVEGIVLGKIAGMRLGNQGKPSRQWDHGQFFGFAILHDHVVQLSLFGGNANICRRKIGRLYLPRRAVAGVSGRMRRRVREPGKEGYKEYKNNGLHAVWYMVLAGVVLLIINVPGIQKLCVNVLGFLLPEAVNIVDQPVCG